jgi:hypothetical protein
MAFRNNNIGSCDLGPIFPPFFGRVLGFLNRDPFLGQPKLEFSGVRAHIGGYAEEPFISDIGGLLPMALCGRISL